MGKNYGKSNSQSHGNNEHFKTHISEQEHLKSGIMNECDKEYKTAYHHRIQNIGEEILNLFNRDGFNYSINLYMKKQNLLLNYWTHSNNNKFQQFLIKLIN